jgi:hypothetical protein
MSRYLKIESDIIADTNGHFNSQNCNVRKLWYAVKENRITEYNNLAQAMLINPEYVIFDRFDNCTPQFNYTTLYYNHNMNLVPHIEFNGWKLGNVYFDYYNNRNTFDLMDPTGKTQRVKLSRYFPDIMNELNKYIICKSYQDYQNSAQ